MNRTICFRVAFPVALLLATAFAPVASAQGRQAAARIQPLTFETPADISLTNINVEAPTGPVQGTDRRSGRARGHERLNQYRLRHGFGTPRTREYTGHMGPDVGTFAWNAADPPRWQGPTHGSRLFKPHVTVQHRRLFNPH